MEFRLLQYFLAVAREETLVNAAKALHITQPTLSRQMKDLEEKLDTQLFVRGSRKISLTEAGILLKQRAEEIINLVEKTENEITSTDANIHGNIYIGGGETDAMRIIAKVVHKCRQDNENIKFHLYSGNAQEVSEKIDTGLLDFGIFIGPTDVANYDFITLPSKDRWGVLMPKDSALAAKEFITPEDLRELELIVSRQDMVANQFSGWLNYDFEELNIIGTCNLIFNASLFVVENNGYVLGLDKIINTTGDSNLCFKPLYPYLDVEINLVWKKYKIFSKAANYFLENLRKELENFNSLI